MDPRSQCLSEIEQCRMPFKMRTKSVRAGKITCFIFMQLRLRSYITSRTRLHFLPLPSSSLFLSRSNPTQAGHFHLVRCNSKGIVPVSYFACQNKENVILHNLVQASTNTWTITHSSAERRKHRTRWYRLSKRAAYQYRNIRLV